MLKLYILRHAQAENDFSMIDHDRPLSNYGIQQASKVGHYLKNIDMALCSSATRTKQTLENAIEGNAPKRIEFLDELYNASTDQLLQAAQNVKAENILVVAHNPGIHMFAHQLVKKSEPSNHLDNLSMAYPPCTLTILDCDIESWADLNYQQNKLIDYITINLPSS